MAPDLLRRLVSKYTGEHTVTPNRIAQRVGDTEEDKFRDPLEKLIFELRDSLGPVLDSEAKLNKFKGRLGKLISNHKYTAYELSMLDLSCVHQDGRINDKEFLWLLKEKGIRD